MGNTGRYDVDPQLGWPLSVWFTPRGDGQDPVLSIEYLAGPKQYLRVWMDQPWEPPEWGWVLPATAVPLWMSVGDPPPAPAGGE